MLIKCRAKDCNCSIPLKQALMKKGVFNSFVDGYCRNCFYRLKNVIYAEWVARLSLLPKIKKLILLYFEYEYTRPFPVAGENIYTIAGQIGYYTIPQVELAYKEFYKLKKQYGLR